MDDEIQPRLIRQVVNDFHETFDVIEGDGYEPRVSLGRLSPSRRIENDVAFSMLREREKVFSPNEIKRAGAVSMQCLLQLEKHPAPRRREGASTRRVAHGRDKASTGE